jgi:Ras-related protein Rab-21
VKKWTGELKQYADKNIVISVAGNKSDMESMRKVKKSEAERYATDNGLKHYCVSAKTGQNIDSVFNDMCEEIYRQKFANEEISVAIKGRKRGVVKIVVAAVAARELSV